MRHANLFFTKNRILPAICIPLALFLSLAACSEDTSGTKAVAAQPQPAPIAKTAPEKAETTDSSIARLLSADGNATLNELQNDAIGALREVAAMAKDPALKELESELQGALTQIIGTGGSILSGVAGGVQAGAEKAQEKMEGAKDGAIVVNNGESLKQHLQVTVHRLEDQGKGTWRLTVAMRNSNDFPVRILGLDKKQACVLLDADGFAYFPAPPPNETRYRDITVVPRAATKAIFTFTGLDARPKTLRLFDTDFPVELMI